MAKIKAKRLVIKCGVKLTSPNTKITRCRCCRVRIAHPKSNPYEFCSRECRSKWRKDDGVVDRFFECVDVGSKDECWNWLKSTHKSGFGQFTINYKNVLAHRVAMKFFLNRDIKDSEDVKHKCTNRKCVNPHHLFIRKRTS